MGKYGSYTALFTFCHHPGVTFLKAVQLKGITIKKIKIKTPHEMWAFPIIQEKKAAKKFNFS